MFGKGGEEMTGKHSKTLCSTGEPDEKDLMRAVSSLSVFILTMQVDQITKNIVIGWVNTVNNYLKRATELGKDIQDAIPKGEWR